MADEISKETSKQVIQLAHGLKLGFRKNVFAKAKDSGMAFVEVNRSVKRNGKTVHKRMFVDIETGSIVAGKSYGVRSYNGRPIISRKRLAEKIAQAANSSLS